MPSTNTRTGWFVANPAACSPPKAGRSKTYRLVLLGPPGVGKGTQAELLARCLGACHLSTGDLFRSAAQLGEPTPAMEAALNAMRSGQLVSDELVMQLMRERTGCLQCRLGFLLDGVPRTLRQAEYLEALLCELQMPLDAVVSYTMPIDAIVERLAGRRTCVDCRAVYHVSSSPPEHAGVCDRCRGELIQRDDDRPEAIRVRMNAYEEATRPLEDYYAARDVLLPISAEGTPEEVFDATLAALWHAPARL
jgi:adenylate kinase